MKKIILGTLLSLGAISLMASNPAQLAGKCKACHGADFGKAPFGRADHIIKGDSYAKIVKMIKYYQHPKESDEMVMKAQVQNLSDTDIKSLAKYIVDITAKK